MLPTSHRPESADRIQTLDPDRVMKRRIRHAIHARRFLQCNVPPTWKRDANVGSGVVSLFARSRPSAVIWAVRPVDINAIQCSAFRSRAHVGKEGREVIAPSVAHGDAATTIDGELGVRGRIAPRFRVLPRFVFRRGMAASPEAMRHASGGCCFSPQATATPRGASREHVGHDPRGLSTVAIAPPVDAPTTIGAKHAIGLARYQAAESLAGQIVPSHSTIIP